MPAVAPFGYQYAATSFPFGTLVKPGGNVVAYVRSTGATEGDDPFAASGLLVATIDAGLNRCRSGQRDVVVVLPGHVETFTAAGTIWPSLKAGSQIISAADPGGSNAPTINLNGAAVSVALNVANVTVHGMTFVSTTAALTAAFVITAAGVTLSNNFINCTGAGAGNVLIQVTGAANFRMVSNYIIQNSTTSIVGITLAGSTNYLCQDNVIKQITSGSYIVADANATGIMARNFGKSATATPAAGVGFNMGAAANGGNFENYAINNVITAGVIATGA